MGGDLYKQSELYPYSKTRDNNYLDPLFYPKSRSLGLFDSRNNQESRLGLLPAYESGTNKYSGLGNLGKWKVELDAHFLIPMYISLSIDL